MDLQSLAIQLSRSEHLPVLPQIIVAVLRLSATQNASPAALEKILEQDPALTAKVLRVANSAYYGMPCKVKTPNAAIQLLGMRTLQSIVISVAYHQSLGVRGVSEEFDRIAFWRHSLAVGSITRQLGLKSMPDLAEELYTVGLLHDVGMLVLLSFCPEEFDKVIQVSRLGVVPQELVEQHIFDFRSQDVGAVLAERWCFGPVMANAIQYQLEPEKDTEHFETTAIVSLANTLAHDIGLGNQCGQLPASYHEEAMRVAGVTEENLEAIRTEALEVVKQAEDTYRIRDPRAA